LIYSKKTEKKLGYFWNQFSQKLDELEI